MMSAYFVGPFGRMLPVINGSSEQEPAHSVYSPAPGNSPYRLPPPPQIPAPAPAPAPAPLQFGTDPFLHQRAPVEHHDSGRGQHHWTDTGRTEQLPSVSQLLTPVSRSSVPPPYHHTQPQPQAFATLTPSYTSHHDSSLASSILTAPVQEHKNLPPITHIPIRNLEDETRPHSRAQSSSSVPPFQRAVSSSSMSQYKGSRGIRSSETTRGTGSPAGNGPHSPPVRSHVIDERYIDGDGLCYVYANGSYCPKIIDGMPVNANWGITKAGKPRKRLAQACLTCREKKIKCHPNLPKCDQCQKAGRVCRFENAPRGNRAVSKASRLRSDSKGNSLHNSPDPMFTPRPSERSTPLPDTGHSPDSDTSGDVRVRETDPEQLYRAKRRRLSRASADGDDVKRSMNIQTQSDYSTILMDVNNFDPNDPLALEWSTDPYEVDPEATTHYMETYLIYVNENLYPIFPRRRFFLWLKSGATRSLDDKMLLNCMLAMGCIFSDRPDKLVAMKRYSRTARYAIEHNRNTLTLQMAQSRIIMSLWYYAIGALLKSWDSVGAAVRTVCGLRYNIESGGVVVDQSQVCEYGLHPQALIECRRRTFWAAFLLDRFSSFYSPSSTFVSSQLAFLRLPCREEIYEAQEYATVPYFQSFMNTAPLSTDDLSALSAMAFLIEIMSLWTDVSDQTFHLSLLPAESYSSRFEEFYATVIQRSDDWAMKLPNDLTITAANLERSIHAKKANAFISNHLFYHATLLKLNRCARQRDLRAFTVDQCIRRARHHSVEILRICLALMQYLWEYESSRLTTTSTTTTTEPTSPRARLALNPFLGYLVLSAVDVLSAAGPMSDLTECIHLIRAGLDVVRELACCWDGALPLVSLIETRVDALVGALHSCQPDSAAKLGFAMDSSSPGGNSLDSQIRDPSLPSGSVDQDLIYGGFLSRERVLVAALGVDNASLSRDSILWIRE